MWQNKIKGRIVQKHSVNGIGKFQAEILMETAEGDYKEGKRRIKSGTSDPSGSEKLFRRSAEYGAGGQSGIYFMGRSELPDVVSVDSGTFHKVKTCAG